MSLGKELLELLTAILPLIITGLPHCIPLRSLGRWVGAVVATAATSLISTGFLLMRSIASCYEVQPVCNAHESVASYTPGIFEQFPGADCAVCLPAHGMAPTLLAAKTLNDWLPFVAIASWVFCGVFSLLTVVRFIRWTRTIR